MRLRWMVWVLFCVAASATMACEAAIPPVEAAQVEDPATGTGRREGEPTPEMVYDATIVRIAGEHALAIDRCEPLTAYLRVDCKSVADGQREKSVTRARKQRDHDRR